MEFRIQADKCGATQPSKFPRRAFCWNRRLLILMAMVCICSIPTSLYGQKIQKVITMDSGLQLEGELAGVPFIVEGSGVFNAIGTQPIVRIDDGLRRVFVSLDRMRNTGGSSRNEIEIPIKQRASGAGITNASIIGIGQFNEHGHRNFTVNINGNPVTYVQGITKITPRYCEVEVLVGIRPPMNWKMSVGTSTIPTDVLKSVLRAQIRDPENSTDYIRVAEFFLQARKFDLAMEELAFIESIFPELGERFTDSRSAIRQARANQILDEVRLRLTAGQTEFATLMANRIGQNMQGLAMGVAAEFRDIQRQYDDSQKELQITRETFADLLTKLKNVTPQQEAAIKRLSDEIESDLNPVNSLRLSAFLRLASDDTTPAGQKVSLAISGWILGSNNAFDNLAKSEDLFTVRDLVVKYLQSKDPSEREFILKAIAEFEVREPEYIAQILAQLNPTHAPNLNAYTAAEPLEFEVEMPGPEIDPAPQKFRCLVHLPPDYDPYRHYPLLITLPGGRQTVEQHLHMWCGGHLPKLNTRAGQGMRNGYVVMAVDWRKPGQNVYQYSAIEHGTILKAMRMALRKFAVDTDRVFISGHGIGAEAAYDVGLSHPEHWAGVLGTSGKMEKYLDLYEKNKHVPLPVYSVAGTKDFDTIIETKNQWNRWLRSRHFMDCTVVHYEGRGNELLAEETPEMFKWMAAQRRRNPDKNGFSFEVKAARPWDSYFWFLEFHGVPADMVIWPQQIQTQECPHGHRRRNQGGQSEHLPHRPRCRQHRQ